MAAGSGATENGLCAWRFSSCWTEREFALGDCLRVACAATSSTGQEQCEKDKAAHIHHENKCQVHGKKFATNHELGQKQVMLPSEP